MSEKKGFLAGLLGGKKSGGCCNMEIIEENNSEATAEQTPTCCCGTSETAEVSEDCCCGSQGAAEACCGETTDGICCIKVLGAGCKSCHKQYENAKKAVSEMGLGVEVEYITDMEKVMAYGVISMPAIVVNNKVASAGRVLKAADVVKLLHSLGF